MKEENPIVQLCASGMEQEGLGNRQQAATIFNMAWNQAGSDYEKAVAAHYVARHQPDASFKLQWDQLALKHALLAGDEVNGFFPSLYLNIAKGFEELADHKKAQAHYQLALASLTGLNEDGYVKMIRAGIEAGMKRVGGEMGSVK